jgi:hypothetical protein
VRRRPRPRRGSCRPAKPSGQLARDRARPINGVVRSRICPRRSQNDLYEPQRDALDRWAWRPSQAAHDREAGRSRWLEALNRGGVVAVVHPHASEPICDMNSFSTGPTASCPAVPPRNAPAAATAPAYGRRVCGAGSAPASQLARPWRFRTAGGGIGICVLLRCFPQFQAGRAQWRVCPWAGMFSWRGRRRAWRACRRITDE